MTTLLEICVENPQGARAARDGGADRVELCAALGLGGVTPSPGLTAVVVAVGLPVNVLIRPVAGDFVYGPAVVDAVTRDIRAFAALGVSGVVVGALGDDRRLDLDALSAWRDAAAGMTLTLHRAIDLCASPEAEARRAAEAGVDRILTSGGARTAAQGTAAIAAMVAAVGDAVEIVAGSGITPANARAVVAATGVGAIHASARAASPWRDSRVADLGFGDRQDRATDPAIVAAIRAAIAAGDGGS